MPGNIKTSTPEEIILVRLVRGEDIGPVLDSCDPEELTRRALHHKVLAPLASRVWEEDGSGPAWRRWAASALMAAERDGRLYARALRRTSALLESQGVPFALLKGASLALGRPRDTGDLDLLLPQDYLSVSIAALEGAGYRYRGFERNPRIRRSEYRDWESLSRWSNQFEFSEPETGTLVELHTAFFETARVYAEDLAPLRAAMGDFLARSVPDGKTGCRFLATEDRALLLALHAGLKRSPANRSFVLRHLLDLRSLAGAGLDWELLRKRSIRYGAAHHLLLLLLLDESVAGSCAPSGYLETLEASLKASAVRLVRLHLSCLRGLDSYSQGRVFAYKFAEPFILRGTPAARLKSLLVFPVLLPTPYELAHIYGLPGRFPLTFLFYLLEPFRWTLRLARKAYRVLGTP